MKVGDTIKIFHDGKVCRDEPAVVLGLRGGGIRVRFTPIAEDEEIAVWCRSRGRAGKYEAIGWNYWILPEYSEYNGDIHDIILKKDMEVLNRLKA